MPNRIYTFFFVAFTLSHVLLQTGSYAAPESGLIGIKAKTQELCAREEFEKGFNAALEVAKKHYPSIQKNKSKLIELETQLKDSGVDFITEKQGEHEVITIEYDGEADDAETHKSFDLAEEYIKVSESYLKVVDDSDLVLAVFASSYLDLNPQELQKEKDKLFLAKGKREVDLSHFVDCGAKAEELKSYLFETANASKIKEINRAFYEPIRIGLYFKFFNIEAEEGTPVPIFLWDLDFFDTNEKANKDQVLKALKNLVDVKEKIPGLRYRNHAPRHFTMMLEGLPKFASPTVESLKDSDKIREILFASNQVEILEKQQDSLKRTIEVIKKRNEQKPLKFEDFSQIVQSAHSEFLYRLVLLQGDTKKHLDSAKQYKKKYEHYWEIIRQLSFQDGNGENLEGTMLERQFRSAMEKSILEKWEDRELPELLERPSKE